MTPRKRKVVKPKAWRAWALIVNGVRDPNLIFETRARAVEWALPGDHNHLVQVEIREVTRKGKRT